MSDQMVPITVAYSDGIGPEIMAATLEILKGAGARIAPEVIEIGEKVYLRGISTGIDRPSTLRPETPRDDARRRPNPGDALDWGLPDPGQMSA